MVNHTVVVDHGQQWLIMDNNDASQWLIRNDDGEQ